MNSAPPFQVSVITPVYNAAGMVRRAVESAEALVQVCEIILIEDGSPDGAIDVCRKLEREFDKVRLLQHPGGENRGAGASRNLGIEQATCPFIAFLDADDWYLPNRFAEDERILLHDDSIDGVYNALANHYESEDLRTNWLEQGRPELLTLNQPATPDELPLVLLHAHPTIEGEFSTDTITVRRVFFDRVGLFHAGLRLQQDTHMWKRMSAVGRLAAGNIAQPVAIRCVHSNNRMTRLGDHHKYMELWWKDLGHQFTQGCVRPEIMQAWRRGYAAYRAKRGSKSRAVVALLLWLLHEPKLLRHPYGFFDLTLRDVFSDSRMVERFLSVKNRLIGI